MITMAVNGWSQEVVTAVTNTFPLYILFIYPVIAGFLITSLKLTPTAILIHLIVLLIIDLLSIASLLGIVALIYTIIALVRWSTYKDWFYKIDPERSK